MHKLILIAIALVFVACGNENEQSIKTNKAQTKNNSNKAFNMPFLPDTNTPNNEITHLK